jgi:hypothetical protein
MGRCLAMTPDNRDQMMQLCRRIWRETDAKRLALWIADLNVIIQRKIDELREKSIKSPQ